MSHARLIFFNRFIIEVIILHYSKTMATPAGMQQCDDFMQFQVSTIVLNQFYEYNTEHSQGALVKIINADDCNFSGRLKRNALNR